MARTGLCGAILAAGHGSITTGTPKLLEKLNSGCTIIEAVVHLLYAQLEIYDLAVAVNTVYSGLICNKIGENFRGIIYAHQLSRRGTADAARLCVEALQHDCLREQLDDILIVYGDMPLWQPKSLGALIDSHRAAKATLSMFAIDVSDFAPTETVSQFGRILHDASGKIIAVKEPYQMDDTDHAQWQNCQRVNPSAWVFNVDWLMDNIQHLQPHDKGDGFAPELWLPDLVPLAVAQDKLVLELPLADYYEALGVNALSDLVRVRKIYRQRYAHV